MTVSDAVATAYDTQHFEDNFPAGVEHHYWFKARNRVLARTLQAAIADGVLPPRPRILEVGCGTGVVVGALHGRGHDIWGVELGRPPRFCAAPDRLTVGTRAQDLPEAFRAGVDALMFLDVIEHVPDDAALLRETLAAFPRCRAVVVTVPARPEVWSNHDTHYGHFRRYTPASLTAALRASGLRPERTRYVFRALYLAAAAMKLARVERRPVLAAPGNTGVHALLAAALCAEDAVLSTLPLPGLSLLAVASRPVA